MEAGRKRRVEKECGRVGINKKGDGLQGGTIRGLSNFRGRQHKLGRDIMAFEIYLAI